MWALQHLENSQWALHGVRAAAAAFPWWRQYCARWNPTRRRIWIAAGVLLTLVCLGFLAHDLYMPSPTGVGFDES